MDHLNIMCNYTVDNFFVYASKYNFSLTTIVNRVGQNFIGFLFKKRRNLLKFLQVVFTVFGSACCSRKYNLQQRSGKFSVKRNDIK